MTVKEFGQGEIIYTTGQKPDHLYLVMKGFVQAHFPGGGYILHPGDVVGLCELSCGEILMEYKAVEKCSLIAYPYEQGNLAALLNGNTDTVKYFLNSFFRQFNTMLGRQKQLEEECRSLQEYLENSIGEYCQLCEKYHILTEASMDSLEIPKFSAKRKAPVWISGYYATLEQMMTIWDHNKTDMDFACGFLCRASEDMHGVALLSGEMQEYKRQICRVLMNETGVDLFGQYVSACYRSMKQNPASENPQGKEVAAALKADMKDMLMQLKGQGYENLEFYQHRKAEFEKLMDSCEEHPAKSVEDEEMIRQLLKELSGSLDKILAYADCDKDMEFAFRQNVLKYKKLTNKSGTEEPVRVLRKELTEGFYQIYTSAFQNSVKQEDVPVLLKMFFNFGYMDEELAGIRNALYLYQLAQNMPTAPSKGIFSFYEWLMAIYRGEKEPGRNEFDLDYVENLREMKKNGRLDAKEEAQLLQSRSARVMYELENVFPVVNKMSYGRISTFCPIFSEHDILRPLDSALVDDQKVTEIFDMIRKIDYSAYYRQAVYSDPAAGVAKEFVDVEILPDIVLMPNIGSRGVMWQEIEGKRRTTPARMMCSVFLVEDLTMTLVRLTAEFRWEMCKRIQGGRWNDVSDPSLTSEYCDYVQFYKKNSELSTAAREKIKNDITRARNSFKELFVRDYMQWILYECNASPRLNKVARSILFTYCPFRKEIRDKLSINPMYKELAERYETRMSQKRHRMENLCQKLKAQGKDVPKEIEHQRQYLEM